MYNFSLPTTTGGLVSSRSPNDVSEDARNHLGLTKGKMSIPLFSALDDSTSYKQWLRAQKALQLRVSNLGVDTGIKGWRFAFTRDQIAKIKQIVDDEVMYVINPLRDRTYQERHMLRDVVLDQFVGTPAYAELAIPVCKSVEALTIEAMTMELVAKPTPQAIGFVPQDEVDRLVLQSAINERMAVAQDFQKSTVELIEALSTMERVRSTDGDSVAAKLDSFMFNVKPFIEQYSDEPDLVEKLSQAETRLRKLPSIEKGMGKDVMTDIREQARDALSIFTSPTPIEEWSEADEEALNDHIADLHASFEPEEGDAVIETGEQWGESKIPSEEVESYIKARDSEPTITELMQQKYSNMDDDDVF